MELLFSNQNLAQLFNDIFSLTFRGGPQIPECIFSTSGIPVIDDSLNNLKKSILSILNLVVSHSVKRSPSNIKYKSSVFFNLLKELIPAIILSLVRIFKADRKFDLDVFSFVF